MKLDLLFNIQKIDEVKQAQNYSAKVSLKPSHSIFKGHFPGKPVLPGVCVIHIVKKIMERIFSKDLQLIKAHTIKFQSPVNPEENALLYFDIKIEKEESGYSANVKVRGEDKIFCSFRGTFAC